MTTTPEQFERWLSRLEDENLEFKEAKFSFSESKDLPDYVAALANEGGGKLILGVKEIRDGNHKKYFVTGTKAFDGTWIQLAHRIFQNQRIKVEVEEFDHPKGRVLIFHI